MKRFKKALLILLTFSLVIGGLYSMGWSQENAIRDEWNILDLLVARPLGIVAGIAGTGVFVLSLPFTIPTGSVDDAAKMFIISPFNFSFVREFPDEKL
ncbi:MAG: hypothetical protein AB1502_09700 [Thermodesulfobacteriota bacterium]